MKPVDNNHNYISEQTAQLNFETNPENGPVAVIMVHIKNK